MMKRLVHFITITALLVSPVMLLTSKANAATFDPNLIIDDVVFDDSNSMGAAQIDEFLNRFPSSCISTNNGFSASEPIGYSPSAGFSFGGNVSAGTVINSAAKVYGLNPQVLLATLQKEQGLVTGGSGCSVLRYAAALGYGCPDSGTKYNYSNVNLYSINNVPVTSVNNTCVNSDRKVGFSQQIIRATWNMKFSEQRSKGNVGWAVIQGSWNNSDDPQSCYSGPMVQGNWRRCPSGSTTYYDGIRTIDGTPVQMGSGATAALYWYTPHFSGNQNFFNLFTNWFGGTVSGSYYACRDVSNLSGLPTGEAIVPNSQDGRSDRLTVAMLNNTGSACTEFHTWSDNSYQGWSQHTASNLPASDPVDNMVVTAHLGNDRKDNLFLVKLRNTGSGKIEIHGWDASGQRWFMHVATNHPTVDPANAKVVAADTNGDGRDEFHLVFLRGTGSGRIETHGWSPDLQGWITHIASNHPGVDPADATVISSDTNGDGRDEFHLIKYRNNGSGKIEDHGWSPDMQGWISHIASNHPGVDPASNEVISADPHGDNRDEFQLIKLRGTGSGRVEVHGWSPDMQGWTSHIATSLGEF